MLRKLLRLLAAAAGLGIAAVLAVVFSYYVQYRRNDHPIVFPAPRGPHPVGRVLMDWTDARRHRELMVFLWYPAEERASGARAEYIPGKWGALEATVDPIPAKRYREIQVSAIENAPLGSGRMPVLVMLPGMGRIPAHYTILAEDLASYGYLIAGVTPTGNSRPVVFSDGRVDEGIDDAEQLGLSDRVKAQGLIDTWAADASFALDQVAHDSRFAERVQLDKTGIFGHSFGGEVAAHIAGQARRFDARFLRAAGLDGGPSTFGDPVTHLDKPLLILAGGTDGTVCDFDRANCSLRLYPQARHMNFSDAGVLPSRFPFPKFLLMLGDVDGTQFLHEVADRLRAFFDQM